MQDLGTLGGRESVASGVSADGAVVVGWLKTPQGRSCLSLDGFWWDAGPRHAGRLGERGLCFSGVSADGSVVVGEAQNAAGQWRAFRWTASGGIEDLNLTYVYVLSCSVTPGSVLGGASAVSSDGRYIVGTGYNAATGRYEAFLLDTQAPFSPNGDVNHDGCVDDIDMLGVLFEFGELVNDFNRCVDVNRDGIIDDADLLIVLFNFGNGC
jgi:probable HAF family extracellular repeat protein